MKQLILLWGLLSLCRMGFADPDPQHCVVLCTSEDKQFSYCAETGCCGFVHIEVTTPGGSFSENGSGMVDDTTVDITSPQTKITATADATAYHGTLSITHTDETETTTVPISCPLKTP